MAGTACQQVLAGLLPRNTPGGQTARLPHHFLLLLRERPRVGRAEASAFALGAAAALAAAGAAGRACGAS
jgi:hypothetical protein